MGPTQTRSKDSLLKGVTAEGGPRPLVQANRRTGARRAPAAQTQEAPADARFLLHLSKEELRWLRLHAAFEGTNMSAVLRRLIAAYRAAHPETERR